ncbi:hypothetical protein JCM10908_004035 [Rhodotorula pacifica]|uniref:uncharacterized protein n=1 Tax=Rhodotorula pacifica TaxID=1495444 RepID=UPI0031726D82
MAAPDDPVISRSPRPRPTTTTAATQTTSTDATAAAATPAVPVPQQYRAYRAIDEDYRGRTVDSDQDARANPLAYLASSSPSRALSRFWDRLSPPSIPSPFQVASAPPYPPAFLERGGEHDADLVGQEEPAYDRFPSSVPINVTPTRPVLEQHDSASQLSFSLRRAAATEPRAQHRTNGVAEAATAQEGRRHARRARTESWESPFRLPIMPWKGKEKQGFSNAAIGGVNGNADSAGMVDDEACFVDGWEGKVDFLASLPSEISLNVLAGLDFRSVLAAGAVSRQWRSLTLDPLLWRDLFHQNPRWHIKPEAYRLAAEAAQAAANEASLASASKTSPFAGHGLSPLGNGTHSGSNGTTPEHRPVMPNLKRAASSFGRAGAKRLVTGADRVSHGGVVIGRKLSEIVGDLNVLSLVPGTTSHSRGSSRTPSEAGDIPAASEGAGSSRPGRESSGPSTPTRPPLLSRFSATSSNGTPNFSLATAAALPSTSTLQTNAFASPPSAVVPRSYSSSALSSLSSAFPAAVTPGRPRPSASNAHVAEPLEHETGVSSPSTPAQQAAAAAAQDRRMGSDYLDWPKLFRDHWLLDQRWAKGKPSWSWFEGHEDSVYCCQFDERKIISGSRDRTIRVWDIASGETIHTMRGHEGSILCLQYDDEILVTGSSDSTVIVWDLVGNAAAGRSKYGQMIKLVGHGMGVLDLCFDDRYIVSCSKDTKTHVWERSSGKLYRVLQGHRGPVNAVQIHGDRVLTASGDSLMKMWDLHTGQALRTLTGHTRGLACVSWAPSGKCFVSSSNDKTIKLWDAETGECLRTFVGHADLVRGLAFDEGCQRIVSAGYDRTTRVWDAETGEMIHKFNSHSSLVFDVSFSASKIVSASHDRRILLMDFGAGLDVDKFF